MPQADFLLIHAGQLLTLAGPPGPRRGGLASELSVVADGALASMNGRVVWVGGTDSAARSVSLTPGAEVLDASGGVVAPGFVDSHTHPLFAGSRAAEFGQRAAGATYEEIASSGGGIASTVCATRMASREEISRNLRSALGRMLMHGTTTVEAKSGYGLDMDTELTCLETLAEVAREWPQKIVPTFMGPHAVPSDFHGDSDGYLDFVIGEVLPVVASRGLALFADIFCEKGAFDADQSRRFLEAARDLGLEPRIHADELTECGGAIVASMVRARSADHLLQASDDGLKALASSGTVATLLPGTAFFLGKEFPDARRFFAAGVPVALATDFNPGSCFTESMPLILSIAVCRCRMTVEQALVSATVNGAESLGLGGRKGALAPGFDADLTLWDIDDYRGIPYHLAFPDILTVRIGGSKAGGLALATPDTAARW